MHKSVKKHGNSIKHFILFSKKSGTKYNTVFFIRITEIILCRNFMFSCFLSDIHNTLTFKKLLLIFLDNSFGK